MIIVLFITLIFLILIGEFYNFIPVDKKVVFWITSIILILIAGFRKIGIDPDSEAYRSFYESDFATMLFLAEPTFAAISFLVKSTFNNVQFVLLVYAIIGISIKFYGISKLTDLIFLSVIVYFGNYFILHDFTQIRAAVASGILLLAIIPLAERKFGKFMLLFIIALLFHYSSIIILPLWFLTNNRIEKKMKYALYLSIPIGILLYLLNFDILLEIPIDTIKYKIQAYKDSQDVADVSLNVFNLVYLIKYLIFYILLFNYNILDTKTKYISILLKIYALSLVAYLSLSQNTIFAMRFSELLGIVEIILIPFLFYLFKSRVIGFFVVITYALIYLYLNTYYIILAQVFD